MTYNYLNKIQIFMEKKIQINMLGRAISNAVLCQLYVLLKHNPKHLSVLS